MPTRRKIQVDFVGMVHRRLSPEIFEKLKDQEIRLIHEPENPYDKFAIRCEWSGKHFAYVEREKSEVVCQLIQGTSSYSVKILDRHPSVIKAEIIFTDIEKAQMDGPVMKLWHSKDENISSSQ